MQNNIRANFGDIDIYLFDQLLKGRFDNCQPVLDAGCGNGRNLVYFLRNGFEVYGIDHDPESIRSVIKMAQQIIPGYPASRFIKASVEQLPFNDDDFALVISSAVLHFARNKQHFENMLYELWRILKPGGFLFARLASDIGIENKIHPTGDGKFLLPDGSERYLINESMLVSYTQQLKGKLFEPIKTTNVQNLRSMTTWCLIK
jgi:tellurite methyltransferase